MKSAQTQYFTLPHIVRRTPVCHKMSQTGVQWTPVDSGGIQHSHLYLAPYSAHYIILHNDIFNRNMLILVNKTAYIYIYSYIY